MQSTWSINNESQLCLSVDSFADVVNAFNNKKPAFLASFTLPERPHLFDFWVASARDYFHFLDQDLLGTHASIVVPSEG
jgi:hypothetical protein